MQLKEYYIRYSKILSKEIKTVKMLHYNNQIIHSHNIIKATWNIIKSETGWNNIKYDKANVYNTDKEYNKKVNAENFNKYILTIAENFFAKLLVIINKASIVLNTHCLIYHTYLIFHLLILFSIIHLQGKLKKLFMPSLGKTLVVMMKFQWRYWKSVHLLLAHHYAALLTYH